jgi:TPR repeat protein
VSNQGASLRGTDEDGVEQMKSNVIHFIFASVIACGLCLDSHATGAKTNIAEKAVAASAAKIAAEKGNAEAQFRYAEMLRDGRSVAKNVREAVTWTRKAADGGLAVAQCQMGLFYMNGLGVEQDDDKTVEWLNKAAAQNHAQAQYNLGIYYAKLFDKESQRLAVKWLGEAAKQDYADVEYNLAKLYLNPHHPASKEQGAGRRAIQLLRLAAAQGHAGAKAKLKELGVAVPKSPVTVGELR